MKRTCLFVALTVCILSPMNTFAQKNLIKAGEKLLPANLRKMVAPLVHKQTAPFAVQGLSAAAAHNLSLQITSQVQIKKPLMHMPALLPFEQHVRHFIFTVSAQGVERPFKGSGFVFAEQHEGQTVLWGFTAAHVVRGMGTDVNVTFYNDGKEYVYPARVVMTGRKYGINAALIQLPPEVAEVARPVLAAARFPKDASKLFTYGFSGGEYKKTLRRVLAAHPDRVVATFPQQNQPRPGFCGSLVVDEKGHAVGIEVGGYSPEKEYLQWYHVKDKLQSLPRGDLSRISEIVPFNRAYDLIREYRNPGSALRVILFDGMIIGRISKDEFVERVTVHYEDGSYTTVMRNPFFNVAGLDDLFNLENAVQADIVINKNRIHTYGYRVNLKEHKAEKIGDTRE